MKNLKLISTVNVLLALSLCSSAHTMNENVEMPRIVNEIQDKNHVNDTSSYSSVLTKYALIKCRMTTEITCNRALNNSQKENAWLEFLAAFKTFTINLAQHIGSNRDKILTQNIRYNQKQAHNENYAIEDNEHYCVTNYKSMVENLRDNHHYVCVKVLKYEQSRADEIFNNYQFEKTFEDNLGSDFMDQINKNINGLNNLQSEINEIRKKNRQDIDEMQIIEQNIITLEDENNVSSQEVPCPQPFEYQEDVNNNNINQHDNSEDETGIDIGNEDSSSEDSDTSHDESGDSYERPDFKNNRLVKGQEYKNLLDDLLGEESSEDNSDNDDDSSYE